MDYRFEEIATDQDSIRALVELMKSCFPDSDKFSADFFEWQYINNPAGKVHGYSAYLGDELAAHYATIPVDYVFNDKPTKGLLSLNTATHRDHQGKGLFSQLAQKTYDEAAAKGFNFVIGVANANSTPGFIRKLGFELVQKLDVFIGKGSFKRERANYEIHAVRSTEFYDWRLANPAEEYQISEEYITTVRKFKGMHPVLSMNHGLNPNGKISRMKMWIGVDPNISKKGIFTTLPEKLKPSPLNLIFRDLTDEKRKLSGENFLFELIDFDAY